LTDWQKGLLYEVAMNYTEDGLRRNYMEELRKKKISVSNISEEDMLAMGYSRADVSQMKGNG